MKKEYQIKYRIFGRTLGRNKRNSINNYNNLLIDYNFNQLNNQDQYILDIGSGYGETSIYLALKYPKHKIISCDKYISGNLNLIEKIKKKNINNIYIHNGHVLEILDNNQINKYFKFVFIFFPDPWPKKKHNKRRLINIDFLSKIHKFIKENGEIYIATDSALYLKDILVCIYNLRHIYEWSNQANSYLSIKDYFELETKFYKKAIISGRKPSLFILRKI